MCLVLYASATGNAADLADTLFDQLRRRDLPSVECKPFGLVTVADLQRHRHIFVICSTTGQGTLPPNAQPLWSRLLKRSLKAPLLANVQLYSFGLGSSSYPRYNWATRKVHSRLLQLGAQEAVPRGEGDDMGSEPYESIFDQWASMALSNLDSELQIIDVKLRTELLPPLNPVKLVGALTPPPSPPQHNRTSSLISARVVENTRITSPSHFQDVRHLKLETETTGYEPGDVVCLYPANDDAVVDAVLESQGWQELADYMMVVPASQEVDGAWHSPLTLRNLLKWHIDLNGIPRRKFFALCHHFCTKPQQKERMQEFATDLDDLFSYTSRPRRSIAEVIVEFDSLRIPVDYILDALPPLRARQFSIASGPQNPGVIELAVSIVKYRTALRRIRRGVCTHWIEQLKPQDTIQISLENNNMKIADRVQADRQTILVATGTGIAPIRSLLKSLPSESLATNPPILFFGCRFKSQDYLYGSELEKLARVIPAFSREGGGYVQQQIEKHASELNIKSAYIFVCGSAGAMPRAVREALVQALQWQGSSAEDADQIIAGKEKSGDYIQETW